MSWLTEILEQHKEFESPINFYYWSALAAISAVVKDNIWVDRYIYKSYANIYVILYADSGLKKGPPINMANQLVNNVGNTRIIDGRSSIQGILKELGTTQSKPGGIIDTKATAFICASELSASIVEDKAALDILTDLYDRSYRVADYKSLLKMETFTLKNPTVSLLGGINAAHAEMLFQKKDVQGGYIARSFIIHESKRQAVNALIRKPKTIPDYKADAEYLKELAKLRGPFAQVEDTPAGRFYEDWYHAFVKKIEDQEIKDSTGTLNRFSESVMKVAMLRSLAAKPELIITLDAMEEAIVRCETLIGNVRKTTLGTGKSVWAQEKALLIEELIKRDNHIISQEQLNKKYWMRANVAEWNEICLSLATAGILFIEQQGNAIVYRMGEEEVTRWKNHLKGK